MDENIKNLREAQQQQKGSQNREPSSTEENDVDVDVSVREAVEPAEETSPLTGREDSIADSMGEAMTDPLAKEQFSDPLMKEKSTAEVGDSKSLETEGAAPKKNKTPMKKLVSISQKLKFRVPQLRLKN